MHHRRLASVLLRGSACVLISTATGFAATAAHAQDQTATSGSVEGAPTPAATDASATGPADQAEIVVTGTRIRGVAPVGSDLLQLDSAALEKTGQLSTADILAKVPAVLTLGSGNTYSGGSSQNADLNAYSFNKSPNLRGFGPQATLSLVNGHRVPYDGANMNTFDGDNIPVQMLQRIDIVADGGSANYGADAITGTVNYIMRAPFTGLEAYGQYSLADGQDSYQGTVVGGYDWGSGGIVVAYQYSHSDRLKASSRPNLYNDDFTQYGGPASSYYSSPGTILYNGQTYAIPAGQDGTNLTLAQIGAAGTANTENIWTGYDAIPAFKRNNVAANFRQDVTDGISIYADGFYSDRDFNLALYSSSLNDRALVTIPNSNYYSPCNHDLTGAPADLLAACQTGSLTVAYNNVYEAGPAIRNGYTRTWDATIGTEVALFGDWKANVYASFGRNDAKSTNTLYLGNSLTTLPALAGTTADSAFNAFCDASAGLCNNGQFNDAIVNAAGFPLGNSLGIHTTFDNQDYAANVDGSLFSLPGGNVRLAVGGEHQDLKFVNANNFATTTDKRHINSVYGELFVPIVGAGNAMPGIQSLEFDGALRLDDYNDVGSTVNPKIGINWSPTDWLKLRGSYGTSFRAPGLVDNDPNSQAGNLPVYFDGSVIDASICPTCAADHNIGIYQSAGGAAGNLKPEQSTSWSFGFEIAPPHSGVRLSATYWNVNYTGQVSFPVYSVGAYQAINQGYYDSEIIYNPAFFPSKAANNPEAFFGPYPYNPNNASCAAVAGKAVTTQVLFDQLVNCINTGGSSPVLGPTNTQVGADVVAINNAHRINAGTTHGDGIDISASYDWTTGGGDWHVGAIGSYVRSWKVAPIATAPVIDEVNHFNYPLRFRGRADASWSGNAGPGDLTLAAYLNYSNSYTIDAALLPVGVSDKYTHIDSYTTVDLAIHYELGDGAGSLLKGLGFTISAQNVFDTDPPLVINTSSSSSIQFDPANASALGRVVTFEVSKKF